MRHHPLAQATHWITAAAATHGGELLPHVVQRTGLSRRAAQALLRQLVDAGWLQRSGSTRKPAYAPGEMRQVVRSYALARLDEDQPWRRDFAPLFVLAPNVAQLLQYAFSELINNAVDHSGGSTVTISLRQTALHLQLLVSDDGCGVFERIGQALQIDEPALAMFELAKGKLSTAPAQHRGHGLFYAARLADVFQLQANAAAFQRFASAPWAPARPVARQGTTVYLAIARDTPRTLDEVLRSASSDAAGYGLERTALPLRLLGSNGLVSRAMARRVALRLAQFRHAELDFTGVEMLGHSFVDELLRVRGQDGGAELQLNGLQPSLARMLDDWRVGG